MTHALYQISLKAHLRRDDGKYLTLIDPDGLYDFPGGRIDQSEQTSDPRHVLQREISEELGDAIDYSVGHTMCTSVRTFAVPSGQIHVFVVHHHGRYIAGEPLLSSEHARYEWLTPEEILSRPDRFVDESEYRALKEYYLEHP